MSEGNIYPDLNEITNSDTPTTNSLQVPWNIDNRKKSEISIKAQQITGMNEAHQPKKNAEINARTILWFLAFAGFAINYMLRINLNIAIVDMVLPTSYPDDIVKSNECYNRTVFATHVSTNNNHTKFSFERMIMKMLKLKYYENGFPWDDYQQGLVLGSYYWLSWATQVPGGIMARTYGTKFIFGLGNLLGCVICAFMPIAAFFDVRLLIMLRVIQGLIVGVVWSSMHNMTTRWIPPNELSTFVTAYMGSSVGVAVFFPLFGYLIAISSWEWVFHLCALIGIIWYIAWHYLVFDTPALHPRINTRERKYIETSLGTTIEDNKKIPIPWKFILTSVPVWMNIISLFGTTWVLFTLMTQAPTYFNLILGWDIKMAALLSGIPHIIRMIFSYLFTIYVDYLLEENKMTRTNVRKFAIAIGNIGSGLAMLALAYSGCNSMLVVIFFTISLTMTGTMPAGQLASIVDISPNFSSILLGLNGMICIAPGFLSPLIVGEFAFANQTIHQWQYVFLIAAAWPIFTGIVYIFFSNSEVQHWNNCPLSDPNELKMLCPVTEKHHKELKKHMGMHH